MELLLYLRSVFGSDIQCTEYTWPVETPFFLKDEYQPECFVWNGSECLVVTPSGQYNLQSMKNHAKKISTLAQMPIALNMPYLSAAQRRNLLESKIAFVSANKQIYFPFWGCMFSESFNRRNEHQKWMTPATQAVFLYLVYHPNNKFSLSELAKALHFSNTTLTRALNELEELTTVIPEGKTKFVRASEDMLTRGFSRMKNPIEKVIYVKKVPTGFTRRGGIGALSEISMIAADEKDTTFVLGHSEKKKFSGDILSSEDYHDFGGWTIEKWTYDPLIFNPDTGRVDDLSLLLSLSDASDERVQAALDVIREKYGLETDEKW